MTCPIGYTCPMIDSLISKSDEIGEVLNDSLKLISELAALLASSELDILVTEVTNAMDLVSDVNGLAEDVRTLNQNIRDWGEAEETAKNDFEAEIEALEEIN